MNLRLVGLLWSMALLVAACASADGSPGTTAGLGGDIYPVADLEIRYSNPDAGLTQSYRVSCLGDTATVTGDDVSIDERLACEALARPEVAQRLVEGADPERICTQQYGGADVAEITGTIDDRPVETTVDRSDGCGIAEWDTLLAALLPAPMGA